jgi:hypothetical protein
LVKKTQLSFFPNILYLKHDFEVKYLLTLRKTTLCKTRLKIESTVDTLDTVDDFARSLGATHMQANSCAKPIIHSESHMAFTGISESG